MKTLLEWLRDNRGGLSDGVYSVFGSGCVSLNESALCGNKVEYTEDKYTVKNRAIVLIESNTEKWL